MKSIRWGLFGCGEVAEQERGPGFYRVVNSQLVAVADRNAARAESFARRHGVARWHDDAAEVRRHLNLAGRYAPMLRHINDRHCLDLTGLLNSPCDSANSEDAMATQVTSARTTAMRKPKAPEANRARILAAAIAEFASRGFKGASMDAIAARTNTTRALINYYFGSKERLYLAVLERVYAEIREAEGHLDLDHLPPVEAIRRIVEFTYNYYVEHEYFVRLVVAENQAKGRHMKRFPALRTVNRPIVEMLGSMIARGQADGTFRPDADPIDVHMAIAALGMFNVTNQYTFGAIFQRAMGAKGDVPGRRRQVADIILSWLKPESVCQPRS